MSLRVKVWISVGCRVLFFALPLALYGAAALQIPFDELLRHFWLSFFALMAAGIAICLNEIYWFNRLPIGPLEWRKNQANVKKWGAVLLALFYIAMIADEVKKLLYDHLDARARNSTEMIIALGTLLIAFWLWAALIVRPKGKSPTIP
jgi:hypothetical protein